jgi:hypothetical protein
LTLRDLSGLSRYDFWTSYGREKRKSDFSKKPRERDFRKNSLFASPEESL